MRSNNALKASLPQYALCFALQYAATKIWLVTSLTLEDNSYLIYPSYDSNRYHGAVKYGKAGLTCVTVAIHFESRRKHNEQHQTCKNLA